METNTPAGMITLAQAEAVTGYSPSAFTDLAYNAEGHENEFVPAAYLPRADGSLKELTRGQTGNFPLADPRLPGFLILEADARKLVEWEAGREARKVVEDVRAVEISKMDYRTQVYNNW